MITSTTLDVKQRIIIEQVELVMVRFMAYIGQEELQQKVKKKK